MLHTQFDLINQVRMINAFYEPKQHWTKNTIVATLISPVKFIHSSKFILKSN